MKTTVLMFLAGVAMQGVAAAQGMPAAAAPALPALSPDAQIASAVQAAPEERRAAATVHGYEANGTLVTLRKGTNDMVCLADKPGDKVFSVACYHTDLEPFMARGREMLLQGMTDATARDKARWKEVEEGKLKMSREPRTLYVMSGTGFDTATGKISDSYLRWVIYTPFATPETTGLSTKTTESAPWLMDAGTAGAHIMISPPATKK